MAYTTRVAGRNFTYSFSAGNADEHNVECQIETPVFSGCRWLRHTTSEYWNVKSFAQMKELVDYYAIAPAKQLVKATVK